METTHKQIILTLTFEEAEVLHLYLSKCISFGIKEITPIFESVVKKIEKAHETEKIVQKVENLIKIRAAENKDKKSKKFDK